MISDTGLVLCHYPISVSFPIRSTQKREIENNFMGKTMQHQTSALKVSSKSALSDARESAWNKGSHIRDAVNSSAKSGSTSDGSSSAKQGASQRPSVKK